MFLFAEMHFATRLRLDGWLLLKRMHTANVVLTVWTMLWYVGELEREKLHYKKLISERDGRYHEFLLESQLYLASVLERVVTKRCEAKISRLQVMTLPNSSQVHEALLATKCPRIAQSFFVLPNDVNIVQAGKSFFYLVRVETKETDVLTVSIIIGDLDFRLEPYKKRNSRFEYS